MSERPSKPSHELLSSPKARVDVLDPTIVQIHMVGHGDDGGPWVHTHGLESFGLPELEIRDVWPRFLLPAAAGLLLDIADYLLNGDRAVSVGQGLALDDLTLVRVERGQPLPGHLDHYEHERWIVVDVPVSYCPLCDEPHDLEAPEPLESIDPGQLPN